MGVAKLTEADGAGNLSRLAKQPRSGLAFTGWRRQRSVVRVQEVFPAPPCHVANAGVGSAHSVGKTLGGRAVGKCAVGTHLRVWVYKAQSQLCVALLGCLVIGGRMSAVSLKLPHAPCAPLSLDNLQVLVQNLPMAFG